MCLLSQNYQASVCLLEVAVDREDFQVLPCKNHIEKRQLRDNCRFSMCDSKMLNLGNMPGNIRVSI